MIKLHPKIIINIPLILFLFSNIIFAVEQTEPVKPTEPAVEKNAAPPAKAELVDINTATETQLITLPGITEYLAYKIIGNRPYANKEELKSKEIIPNTVYDLIKDKIKAVNKAGI